MTPSELIRKLSVIDEDILAAAAIQPQLFIDAARYRVDSMRKRAVAVAKMEQYRAKLALYIRRKRNSSGDKVTEGYLKERVEINKGTVKRRSAVERSYEEEEFSKLLLEAYRYRMNAVRIIADAQHIEGMKESGEVERIEAGRKLRTKVRELQSQKARIREEE